MLTERIIGALTFKKEVFAEVEKDESFTQTAWMLVAVIAFLNQLGTRAGAGLVGWLVGTIIGTVLTIVAFALAAAVVSWVGKTLFNAEVTFEEMVRTLGLAYVWNVVGVIGIVALITPALACILSPIAIIAAILGLIAWVIAAQEALDLGLGETIITVIVGWLVMFVVNLVIGGVLGLFGLGASSIRGALRS